jgi:hypothetical protein
MLQWLSYNKLNKLEMKSFVLILFSLSLLACTNNTKTKSEQSFDDKVEDYIKKFPYQDTYNYMIKYTGGNPAMLNKPTPGEPQLTKAGEDKIVRMNNDTYYTGGFIYLKEGPVKLSASYPDSTRFYSFQLNDERNCNFYNIINPVGDYYIYFGEKPEGIAAEKAIEAPSLILAVITRVEVKDLNDPTDIETAKKVFHGLNISGPEIKEFPKVDLLSSFDDNVVSRANELMDSVFANVPFSAMVASPEQIPNEVSYLNLAAGTKNAWGGPVVQHSTYQMIFFDTNDKELEGSKGTYTITTNEPPVSAFWSLTVYDTERGGFFHPNKDDRYHINNTTAVKNDDGTFTFTFKTQCTGDEINCIEVPPGKFDITVRYYLPQDELISGQWSMPLPVLK